MHRRTIVQLSRRHAVDWPGAARLRDTAQTRPPRRCFHPSLSSLNSSDPSSTSDADTATGSSASPGAAPKFGARWGPKKVPQPTALSPEEQVIRQALLSKSDSQQQQQQSQRDSQSPSSASRKATPRFGTRRGGKRTQQQQSHQDSQPPSSTSPKEAPRFPINWGETQIQLPVALGPEEQAIRQPLLSRLDSEQQQQSQRSSQSTTSAGPKAAPIFGVRWGGKQTQQPAALSAEEQAIRQALISKSDSQQQQQQSQQGSRPQTTRRHREKSSFRSLADIAGLSEPYDRSPIRSRRSTSVDEKEGFALQSDMSFEAAGRNTIPKHLRAEDWSCPVCHFPCYGKHRFCRQCGAERPALREISSRQQGPGFVPNHLRYEDWTCPDCHFLCFGKHKFCPMCRAERPGLRRAFSHQQPSNTAGDSLKIRRLTPSSSSETDGEYGSVPREEAFRKYIAQQNEPAGTGTNFAHPTDELVGGQNYRSRRYPKPAKSQEAEVETDPWSWDPSSLDHLKLQDEGVEHGKKAKRREGRWQRESEAEEGEEFDEDDHRRRREERKRLKKERSRKKELDSAPTPLYLPEFISVSNFADVVGMRPAQFVERMEEMGFEDVSYSHVLDTETAGLIATEFGFEPIFDTAADDLISAPEPEDKSMWPTRPPVVTIMGHVDHGKTTILDWLRKSSVAASEHGGITQHIGAFSVSMPSGKMITFLDTPGHAAFLDMRRRGADVTDIVVLVVAADDSVKPQTIEAIKHATGANVPIIVAMSKIDKQGINPEKVKQDLAVHGVHVEDYGGDVQAIGVSGKTGQGMLELEEAIITLSEVLDHRSDPDGVVEGWVIEGTTKSYGRVATTLIRRGTLRPGDIIVAGTTWARVRTLRNEAGVSIPEATPGMPVEVDGWREQPIAGTEFLQAEDEQQAKDVVDYRQERSESQKLSEDIAAINEARREILEKRQQQASGLDEFPADETPSGPKPIQFIIKADVAGSAEAVMNSVTAVGNNEVYANVLRSEVGPVSEFDIEHAASADGHVISFNMPIDTAMSRMAELRGVRIMNHNIIYKLIDDVKETLSEYLPPLVTHRVTGEAEIGQIFEITLKGRVKTSIAGCKVRNGMINRTKKVRVLRGQKTIYDGSISSLKNVKKDVTEMRKDTECGIGFEGWTDFAVGDQIQCYEEIFEKRYL